MMIRIKKIATREIHVCWDTGMEYQFLKHMGSLIENRNHLEKNKENKYNDNENKPF